LIRTPVNNETDENERIRDASYVLVVDDNPDMRDYLKNILDRKFTVVAAKNGVEALKRMEEQAPQLVVSDVMMPEMDGIQLLKAIKENKKYERIPVILLTARAGEESKIEGYHVGADDYLVKPFSTKELLARITAQLAIRKKIEEHEKQLEYFIKKAPVGIVIYKGPDFIVEAANDKVLEMWDKTLLEVKGRALTNIFPEITKQEDVRALYKASVDKFLKGETFAVNETEFTFQRKGQPYKGWYNCTYEPLIDLHGNATGIIAVVTEVTEQVIARKKIEESEEKFRTLATEFPLFVWLTDDKLQTTFLNKTGLDYFNLPQIANIGELSWKKFIHPDDIEKVLAVMNDAARRQKSYTLTMRLKNGRTGEYRWFVDNGMPQYFNGKFNGFIGTSMDIHEQKTADEKVRESEERFRFLFDSNVLPVAFWHISGEIYDANDSFLKLMGYTRQEMQQGELNWRKFTLPEDAPMHEDKVQQAVEGKTVAPYQTQYISKSGERVSSLVGYAMLTGSREKGIAFMQDIRKIKEVESALRQSEEKYRQLSMNLEKKVSQGTEELRKLNEADKLKSDFIKMASHELKTPVTSIKGYTQLLLSALKEDESKLSPLLIKSSLVSVDKQITRLTRLMSELLDLSKIETGMLVLNKELFNLNELVIETVQDILYTNSKHNINIFHDFESKVDGDKDRIGQVLINFLTNAIKYSPNSDKVEVWIRQSEKNWVSISVKDFGIGVDEKDHEKIFERFYRAGGKEEQTFPGFGIGLFIAKEIIQRHGGTIGLTSQKGVGSIFTFTLPAVGNKAERK
jgi:PAS domain S-box-containing protein